MKRNQVFCNFLFSGQTLVIRGRPNNGKTILDKTIQKKFYNNGFALNSLAFQKVPE